MGNNNSSDGEDVKNTTSSTTDTATDKDVKETAGEKTIPYERFREINTKHKEAEKKIQELEAYKQQVLDKEKKVIDDEALKRGEFDKILSTKDQEIQIMKEQLSMAQQKDAIIKGIAEQQIKDFVTLYGEDSYNDVKLIIDSEDPIVIMNKLPTMAKFIKEKSGVQKGGTDMPRGGANITDRLAELQKKAVGSQLTYTERTEYFQLLNKTKK